MVLTTAIFASALLPYVLAQTDNANECSCFVTNGSSSGYFSYHRFHDYRNISPAPSAIPSLISNANDTTNALATSEYFTSSTWAADWVSENWDNSHRLAADNYLQGGPTLLMINSPNNIYIESSTDKTTDYSTYLTLRTARLSSFQSAAEFDSVAQNFRYLSARFMARVVGSAGACAGMFTYLDSSQGADPMAVQEADIEILTSGPRSVVQYTNQPSQNAAGVDNPEATVNGTNPGNKSWEEWAQYRVDWMPGQTSWFVDGQSVAHISFQAPRDPAGLIVNMWSDGGAWTKNMSVGHEAYLQIQWIEVVYNTSGPASGKRDLTNSRGALEKRSENASACTVVCSIDEMVNVTGTPAVLVNNTTAGKSIAPENWNQDGIGYLIWIPLILAAGALFG